MNHMQGMVAFLCDEPHKGYESKDIRKYKRIPFFFISYNISDITWCMGFTGHILLTIT